MQKWYLEGAAFLRNSDPPARPRHPPYLTLGFLAGITKVGLIPLSSTGLGHWSVCILTAGSVWNHSPYNSKGASGRQAASPGYSFHPWNLPGPGRERSAGHSHGLLATWPSHPLGLFLLQACPSSSFLFIFFEIWSLLVVLQQWPAARNKSHIKTIFLFFNSVLWEGYPCYLL